MKKIFCLLMSVVMISVIFCGCEDKENIAMEDLPYGSTMRQLNDASITICFDGRFLTDEEMRAVSDYYYAVQTQDEELFRTTQNEEYVKYLENNSGLKLKDFLKSIEAEDSASLGENFEYTYIEAVNYGDSSDDMEIKEIIELMNSIYEENGKSESFEDTINTGKFVTLDFTAESDGKSFNYSDQIIYIFDCKDGIYIFN